MKVIKETTPQVKTTVALMLLDDSGSMGSVVNQTLAGFNERLESMKKMVTPDHNIIISIVKFSDPDKISLIRSRVSPLDIVPLTLTDYNATGGSTALLDAMDYSIRHMEEMSYLINQPGNAALAIFLTDGGENSSQRIKSKAIIKEKIKALTNLGNWTFTYMGIESADEIENGLGIYAGNVTNFQFGPAGMVANSQHIGGALNNYFHARSIGATAMMDFYSRVDTEETSLEKEEDKKQV